MQLTSWLDAFRSPYRRTASHKAARRRLARRDLRARSAGCTLLVAETLEDRTLLSGGSVGSATTALQQGVNGYAGMTNAYISQQNDTSNFATSTSLYVKPSGHAEEDALLRWDLTSAGISAAGIQSASITLNVTSTAAGTYNLYQLLTPWNPTSVTWDDATATQGWNVGGAYGASDSGTTVLGTLNATGLGQATLTLNSAGIAVLQSWLNNPSSNDGMILRAATGGTLIFSSNQDPTAANHPILTINSELPGINVNPGNNQAVEINGVLSLDGSVTDNDPGSTQPVSTLWTEVSGPGTVTFQSPSALTSDALFSTVGTYVLQLAATDGTYSSTGQVTITVEPPPSDIPPTVSAGSNQTIALGQTATLAGQVSDLLNNPVTSQWSQLSGPGAATFATPTSATTTVQFSATGTYVLDLVATDGTLAANSTVTVTVNATSTTPPPVASAGANQTVNLGTTVNLSGTVTDSNTPGVTLTTVWQLANGPGTVTFGNSASLATTATFSAAGTYYLRLLANYGGVTDQSYVTITVNAATSPTTTELQQGLNGYTGFTNTYLSAANDTTTYSTSQTLSVNANSKKEMDTLMSWNLASSGISGTIQSATITVDVTTSATGTFNLYALSRPWNLTQANFEEATSTTNWQVAGANGAQDYNSTVLGTLTSPGTGFNTITLNAAGIAVLQSWLSSPSSNYGFIIKGTSTAGSTTFFSSNYTTVADRPALTITTAGQGGAPPTNPPITNPAASATTAVNGTSGSPGYMEAVGLNLATLYFQYLEWQQNGSTPPFAANLTQANIAADDVSGTNVAVFVTTEPTLVSTVSSALQALGMKVTVTSSNSISGWLPIAQLANAAVLHGLVTAIPSTVAIPDDLVIGTVAAPAQGSTPSATAPYDPAQIRTAYGLNQLNGNGAGITIAIVDAFNDPDIIGDANAFSALFGLPQFNQPGGPTLTVLNQTGGTALPANSPAGDDWTTEESLDVEWAHTIAPQANIILYEANSDAGSDLYQTEFTAAANPNVAVISNSWGSAEFQGEQLLDPIFTTPAGHQGVTFLAATGDDGPPAGYPSTSPSVVSVGGTTLTIQPNGTYVSESVWNELATGNGETAGGVSILEPQPGYQIGKVNGTNSTNRVAPDVSMDADPVTGVFVVDSFDTGNTSTLLQIGGTSLASPMWAALVSIADELRTNAGLGTLDGPSQTLPRLYNLPSTDFHDITTGSNGYPATPGYDLATGLGTPIANLLVPDLAGVTSPTQTGPSVTLSDTGNPFSENGGTSVITATLSQASLVPVTIDLEFAGLPNAGGFSATLGTQYKVSAEQITIAPGQTAGSVTITGIDDGIDTGDETIVVTLVSVTNGTVAHGTQQLNIVRTEADVPELTLSVTGGLGASQNILEELTSSTITVVGTLTHPTPVGLTVTVGFSGDAIWLTNYTISGQTLALGTAPVWTFTIGANQTSGSFVLQGLANAIPNVPTAPGYITVLSIAPTGTAVVSPAGATTTMLVEDPTQTGTPVGENNLVSLSISGSPANENGGQMVVTITQTHPIFNATVVQLNLSGTAALGTNYTVTDADGDSFVSGDSVFINSPNFTTTITITAINDGLLPPPPPAPNFYTVIVSLGAIANGSPNGSADSVTGDIAIVNTVPDFGLSLSSTAFTEAPNTNVTGGQDVITAKLGNGITAQSFNEPVTVNLSLSGTAIANLDYTVTGPASFTDPTSVKTLSILIPAGSTSGSVTLTGLSDPYFEGLETVTIGIASVVNASLTNASQTITAYLVDQQVPIEFSAEGTTVPEGGIAQVTVGIPSALPFAVSVNYLASGGNTNAYAATSGTLTFAPGQTTQTAYIQTNDNGNTEPTQAFSVVLSNPTIVGAAPGAIATVTVGGQPVGLGVSAPATVTMLNSIQLQPALTGATSTSGLTSPPDIAGASGDGFVVLMVNGQFDVYSSSGQLEATSTLTQFWTNATGTKFTGTPTVPRIMFVDGRWVAVALDETLTSGVEQPNNNILLAVSNNSDPTQGWEGVAIPTDPTAKLSFATSVALGFDSNAVIITTDMSNGEESLTVDPDTNVFLASGTALAATGITQIFDFTSSTSVQPTFSLDSPADTLAQLFGIDSLNPSDSLGEFNVLNAGTTTPAPTISGPVSIPSPANYTSTLGGSLPDAGQPGGTTGTISTGTNAITSNVYEANGDQWLVQTVVDPTTGNTDLQWLEISGTTIVQSGLISDPRLSYYDPSIAVNAAGDVVIGFTGSAADTPSEPGQFASAYAVMGTTTNGVTTFTAPILLSEGIGIFATTNVFGEVSTTPAAWGNYSSTVLDGDNPASSTFWTFQEVATGPNAYSVEMFRISFGLTATVAQPTVTLSTSNSSFDATSGTATITATLGAPAANPVTIELGFTGSAVANVDYSITDGQNAVIQVGTPIEIVIPAGQTSGSIILNGLPDAVGGVVADISIEQINGAAPVTPQQVQISLIDSSIPQFSIEDLTVDATYTSSLATPDANVVVQLNESAGPVSVDYTINPGSATLNNDYLGPTTGTLNFADGVTTATIPIPILSDPTLAGDYGTFTVVLSNQSRGSIERGTGTVTVYEEDPLINIEDTSATQSKPTTAQLTVQLSEAASVPVTVQFNTVDGTAKQGVNYTEENSSIVFAAGQTTQTINIPILGNSAQQGAQTFTVDLSSTSLGTISRSQATVTLFDVTPGTLPPDEFESAASNTNFTASTSASGQFSPADPSGAVSDNFIALFDSDIFTVTNKSNGTVPVSESLNQFWGAALTQNNPALSAALAPPANATPTDYVYQPHIVYDPTTGRWFASAVDGAIPPGSDGPASASNYILLAVSNSSDPTQGWTAFAIQVDSTGATRAAFDLLGFNSDSVVVTANVYNIASGLQVSNAVLSVPKADLTGASPTITRATFNPNLSIANTTSYNPAIDYDSTVNEVLLGETNSDLILETVSGGGGPTASVTSTTSIVNVTLPPIAPPQPAGAPPLTSGPGVQTGAINGLDNRFSGTIVQIDGFLWAAQTVLDPSTHEMDDIEWYKINLTTDSITQSGFIRDPNLALSYYYPSISANSDGDVAIGFNGSSLTQQISSYAVYGTSAGNVPSGTTTFTSPVLLQQGTGIYAGFSNAAVSSATLTALSPTFNTTGAGNTDTITVNLASPATGQFGETVVLGFSGTALANRDYSITGGTNGVTSLLGAPIEIVIPEGQSSGSVVLTGLNSSLATGDDTLNVSIVSINGTAPATPQQTALTLVDQAAPKISIEDLTVIENSPQTAQLLVRLSEPVLTTTTVTYQINPNTAVEGTDYSAATTGSVTFLAGQTVAPINISLLDNAGSVGKPLSFFVDLTSSTRGTITRPDATVTLVTDNPANNAGPNVTLGIAYSPLPTTFAEDSGTATVTATLSAASTTDTVINLSFGGTASFGVDYTVSSESIFIPKGSMSGFITLTGTDVAIGASDQTVTVGIATTLSNTPSVYGATEATMQIVGAANNLTPGNVASASISGVVTDSAGDTLAGITVYLLDGTINVSANGTNGAFNPAADMFTTTNSSGQYSFSGLAAGTYTVVELVPTNYIMANSEPNFFSQTLTEGQQVVGSSNKNSAPNFENALTAVWGEYSATAVDPSTPGVFWTFQAFDDDQSANDFDTWGVQATQLAVTNFTSDSSGLLVEQPSIPVTITDTSKFFGTGGDTDTITFSIAPQTTATTLSLGFSGSAEPDEDYRIETSQAQNSYFVPGAPVQVIIPAGQTSGSITLEGEFAEFGTETVVVSIDQINLATQSTPQSVTLNLGQVTVSAESTVAYMTSSGSTGFAVVPVYLSNALSVATTVNYITVQDTNHNGTIPANPPTYTAVTSGSIVILANKTEGFISIPLSGTIPQDETFLVLLVRSNGTISLTNDEPTVTLVNTQPSSTGILPTVSLALSSSTIAANGGTTTFTATLPGPSTTDTVIDLAFQPTPEPAAQVLEGQDYLTTSDFIVIPAGQSSASITITGNDQNSGTFVLTAMMPSYGAYLPATTSFDVTITPSTVSQESGLISGEITGPNGPMAGVYVFLNSPIPVNVFDPTPAQDNIFDAFEITDQFGFYSFPDPGIGNWSISELPPPGYVQTSPAGNYYTIAITTSSVTIESQGSPSGLNFTNELPESADPSGAVGPTNLIQVDNDNYLVYNKVTGTVVQSMTLDQFFLAAWNQESADGQVKMNAFEPHVVYDSASGRWYMSALDASNPPYTPYQGTEPESSGNDFLLAVSKDSNPLDGWVEFVIPADVDNVPMNPDPLSLNGRGVRPLRADNDTIGFNSALNSTALVLTANLYDGASGNNSLNPDADPTAGDLASEAILSIPKDDLLSATTTNDSVVMSNYTDVSNGAYTDGVNDQSVVSYDPTSSALVLGQTLNLTTQSIDPTMLTLTTILDGGTSDAIIQPPVTIPINEPIEAPIAAPQPNHAPPVSVSTVTSALDPGIVDDGIDDRLSNVVEIGGNLWTTFTVLDPTNTSTSNPSGTDGIAWIEISLATDTIIQGGLISSKGTSDPNLFFYFPSIAVNSAGDVVIGFDGSDQTQFISSYAVVGTTFAGQTTFTSPQLLKQGVGVFSGTALGAEPGPVGPQAVPPAPPGSSSVPPPQEPHAGSSGDFALWGAYSATFIDPTNSNAFWTFQSIADGQFSTDINTWGVQSTLITIDDPSVTLTVTGPPTVSTPQSLGVLGDNWSAGDVTGSTPGWVAQLAPPTGGGEFSVQVGGNQAVDGAVAAGLATQYPQIASLASTLNYTVVMIGSNDAVALAKGTETAAVYISSVQTEIETDVLSALQSLAPGDHLIVATVPDIFDTPAIQNLTLSAATIAADQVIIQQVNANITEFALSHKIPVIDLYAATDAFTTTSLSIGGVTIPTVSLFASDGLTPSTIFQGLIANMVIEAADLGYLAGLKPFSDQQLLTTAGITGGSTGPTYVNVAPFVLAPAVSPITTETITATLSTPSDHDIVVNLSLGGSVAGKDYFTTSQSIVIIAGQTSGSVTLTGLGEPSAVIVAGISSPPDGAVQQTAQQLTTILETTPSVVTLSASPTSFSEADGTTTVTATLFAKSSKPTLINLTYTEPNSGTTPPPSTLNQFPVNANVFGATTGPNGNIWFSAVGEIGEINPATGAVVGTPFPVAGDPLQMTFGPNGNLWFLDESGGGDSIDELNPTTGAVSSFGWAVGFGTSKFNSDTSLVVGPDGNLWFTDIGLNEVIGITPSGTVAAQVGIPIANAAPEGMVVADGNLWIALNSAGVIEQFSVTTHTFVPFTVGTNADPNEIIVGPNNNLWFTESGTTSQGIGEMTTAGALVQNVPLPDVTFDGDTFQPNPVGLVKGPDGNVYFSISNTTSTTGGLLPPYLGIYEITPTGAVSRYYLQSATTASFAPNMFIGPDNNIWFPIDGQAAVGQIAFTTSSGGSTVPSNIFVSSLTIFIPAGQTSGSVMITGDDTVITGDETVITSILSETGAYAELPQQATATLVPIVATTGTISGTVTDTSSNGLPDMIVYLGTGAFDPTTDPFTNTASDGSYALAGLTAAPTSYTVRELVPTNLTVVTPPGDAETISLSAGETQTVDFVDSVLPSTILLTVSPTTLTGNNFGTATVTASLTSVLTNNVVITLDFSGTAVQGAEYFSSSQTIVIAAGSLSGSVTLTGIPVNFDTNPSLTIVATIVSVMNAPLPASTTSVTATLVDNGDVVNGQLSGTVYNDENYNGTKDSGEPGLPNVIVYLSNGTVTTNPNSQNDPFTFSNANGLYSFVGLNPATGPFNIFQVVPTGYGQTEPAGGGGYLSVSTNANVGRQTVTGGPAITAPAIVSVSEDGTVDFVGGNAITVADPGGAAEQLSLSVKNGTLSFGAITGLTFTTGTNGSASMTVAGTLANLNADLATLSYSPNPGYTGTDILSLSDTDTTDSLTGTDTVAISDLNFGDAQFTNPSVSLNISAPTISSSGGTATATISLAQTTPLPVSIEVEIGGSAPFSDYQINGTTLTSPTFTVTIPRGQLSATYTIKAIGDATGTAETITFTVVSVTNGTFGTSTQVETAILPATSGSSQLVVDSPSQVSGTVSSNPTFPISTTPTYLTAANQPDAIISADLNGNGSPDLVVVNSAGNSITVILNPTSASPNITTYSVGSVPTAVIATDLNGDGSLDLAVASSAGVSILKNDGTGHFTVTGTFAAGTSPSAIAAGDFNGDGKIDLAVANSGSNNVSILFGNGNFTFQTAVNITVGPAPTDIKAADLNGDGKLDLVVANSGMGPDVVNGVNAANTVSVLLNNGNGTFTESFIQAGIQPRSLALADFNGDGHLDIAVANVGYNPNETGNINTVSILYGNGAGSFTPVALPVSGQPLPSGSFVAGTSVWSIAAGDLNGDGLPDIVVTNNAPGDNSLTVLINNGPQGSGAVTFQAPQTVSVGTGRIPVSVVLADFNGAGTLDIASANVYGTGGVDGVSIFQNLDTADRLVFHVYLSHPSTSTVLVHYTTQNGTGQANTDYEPVSGILIFAPGQTVETVSVPILPGAGQDKTVLLQLSSPTDASVQIGTGVGTINPPAPVTPAASVTLNSGTVTVVDFNTNDTIQLLQLSPGLIEVMVNGEELGIYNTSTNAAAVLSPNGGDNIYVDEEVSLGSFTVVDPTTTDKVFAELPYTMET